MTQSLGEELNQADVENVIRVRCRGGAGNVSDKFSLDDLNIRGYPNRVYLDERR